LSSTSSGARKCGRIAWPAAIAASSAKAANALGFGDSYVPSLIEAQEKLAGVSIVPR
jgi:hypothetical protein